MMIKLEDLAPLLNGYIRDLVEKNAADIEKFDTVRDQYAGMGGSNPGFEDHESEGALYVHVLCWTVVINLRQGYYTVNGVAIARATEFGLARLQKVVSDFFESACNEWRESGNRSNVTSFNEYEYRVKGSL